MKLDEVKPCDVNGSDEKDVVDENSIKQALMEEEMADPRPKMPEKKKVSFMQEDPDVVARRNHRALMARGLDPA
jgi:hypothetical protein